MTFIDVRDVWKIYHLGEIETPVLKGVSLKIEKGEMIAFMGASGSGKSTLMNVLGCLDRPTRGECWIDGHDTGALTKDERALLRNQRIGFVFQNFQLLPRTSALDNVMMPLVYSQKPELQQNGRKRAIELLERVGLKNRLDHFPSQLSGGQQQRVAIARALINQPPLIFADEPTGNLDSKASDEVLQMFEQLNKEEGITIVLVTHEADIAARAPRVVRIRDGLIESDTGAARV